MLNFKVRTNSEGMRNSKHYTDGSEVNGAYINNAYYPEFAPGSMGGSFSGNGNCTWYAFGRWLEVFGFRPERPGLRGDAIVWRNSMPKSDKPEVGGIVVFEGGDKGHVAFIEHVVGGVAYLSESAWSPTTGGFLFKYGRTIQDVEREWGYKAVSFIKPHVPCTSYMPNSKPGKYLNFHPQPKYGLYNMGVVPVAKNINHYMQPINGYSYEIQESTKYSNVFVIKTDDFGLQQVYLDTTRASMTDKPLYQLKGNGGAKPSKPANKGRVGQPLVAHMKQDSKLWLYSNKELTDWYPVPFTISSGSKLVFDIVSDHDPVFGVTARSSNPLSGVPANTVVYIKYEPGLIGFTI